MLPALLLLLTLAAPEGSHAAPTAEQDLSDLSLEALMNVEVRSVGRKRQKLAQAAAAVFVVTEDDIRRSGASSIPEVLRMVPGLRVARVDSNKWAISARGFTGRFADKMLVLIDGRSVYTNLYSGVFWEQNEVFLEDVARIEVIRGPGATMWGANAVNGVINVITKTASETQGKLVTASTGNDELGVIGARYGGQSGKVSYRIHSKQTARNNGLTETGGPAYDRWNTARGGGRVDVQLSDTDSLTVHGDAYAGTARQWARFQPGTVPAGERVEMSGGYGLGQWRRTKEDGSEVTLQSFLSVEGRTEGLGDGTFRTFDVDVQQRKPIGERHDVVAGLGYRYMWDEIVTTPKLRFDPSRSGLSIWSGFVQDDVSLARERVVLTLGAKVQHNGYTGLEVQPGVRISVSPSPKTALWASTARAVRTPSRKERDLSLGLSFSSWPGFGGPVNAYLNGSREFRSEVLMSYEGGVRRQLGKRLSLDVALFEGRYSGLITSAIGTPSLDASSWTLSLPLTLRNGGGARSGGVETAATLTAHSRWRITGSHGWLRVWSGDASALPGGVKPGGLDAAHQGFLRSEFEPARRWSLDTSFYYTSRLRGAPVDAVTRVDVRAARRFGEGGEISAGVRNLLNDRQLEFAPEDYTPASRVRRSVFVKMVWRF